MNTQKTSANAVFLILFLQFALAVLSQAAPGDLDPSFGGTGAVRVGYPGGDDRGNALLVQLDDKVVVAGYAPEGFYHQFLLIRYNADGSLDTSFGVGGKVRTTFTANGAEANAMALQSDGKIVAAGQSGNPSSANSFALARYNADGSLDTTFGVGGLVTTVFGGGDHANAVAVQSDGKIVAAGVTDQGQIAVARYNTDGSLDPSFSGDGKLTTSGLSGAAAIAIQGSKIIIVGKGSSTGVELVRYNGDGTLDTSLGGTGIVFANRTGSTVGSRFALGIQPNGMLADKIVVATGNTLFRFLNDGTLDTAFGGTGMVAAGTENSGILFQVTGVTANRIIVCGAAANPSGGGIDFTLSRYLLSGTLDTAFGNAGVIYTPVGAFADYSQAMRNHSNKIVVAGLARSTASTSSTTPADVAVVRYNQTDGSLDASFDGDGKRVDDFGDRESDARGVVLQPDAKIVVAGDIAPEGQPQDIGLARFNPDGSLDPSFGTGGRVAMDVNGADSANGLALQTDGKIVVAGQSTAGAAIIRFNGNGSLDSTFNGGVAATISGFAYATAVALQADGKIVAAGYSAGDFAVARYLTNGTPDPSFGNGGLVVTGIGSGQDDALAIKVQTDGKILVAGDAVVGQSMQFAVVRYNANGSLDFSFGSFGMATTDFPGLPAAFGLGMALQPDGRIVVAGAVATDFQAQNYQVGVARFLANGSLDSSFDGDGRVTTSIGIAGDLAYAVALQAGAKILTAGFSNFGGSMVFNSVRYNPDGSLDESFGFGGKVLVDPSSGPDVAYAIAIDSSGRAIIAGDAGDAAGVVRLQGDSGTLPAVLSAVSRKTHGGAGTFDINLPLTGTPGVECRTGANHQVIVTFGENVTVGGVGVAGGGTAAYSVNGAVVTITVTPNDSAPKRLTITLQSVNSAGDVVIPMNLLVGDVNGNGTVNGTDVSQVKSQSGITVTINNFRSDVNASGTISATDVGQVKATSGGTLPPANPSPERAQTKTKK